MRLAVLVLMLSAFVARGYRWREHDPLPEFPRVMLWAWERPEKLDFINPRETGVAFLARFADRFRRQSIGARILPRDLVGPPPRAAGIHAALHHRSGFVVRVRRLDLWHSGD